MINSAEEFIKLRTSNSKEDVDRATYDDAEAQTWIEVIDKYPTYKEWVIHNKTVPVEVLESLATDADPRIRSAVARKRMINDKIFRLLAADLDVNVRQSLISNTGLSVEKLKQIKTDDSDWLKRTMLQKLNDAN
jgi:hypothetical protein